MVFSSTLFLFYFLPVFLGVYWLVPTRFKNGVALVASLLFYAWGGLSFLALFLGSVVVNFFLIRGMAATEERWRQRIFFDYKHPAQCQHAVLFQVRQLLSGQC